MGRWKPPWSASASMAWAWTVPPGSSTGCSSNRLRRCSCATGTRTRAWWPWRRRTKPMPAPGPGLPAVPRPSSGWSRPPGPARSSWPGCSCTGTASWARAARSLAMNWAATGRWAPRSGASGRASWTAPWWGSCSVGPRPRAGWPCSSPFGAGTARSAAATGPGRCWGRARSGNGGESGSIPGRFCLARAERCQASCRSRPAA